MDKIKLVAIICVSVLFLCAILFDIILDIALSQTKGFSVVTFLTMYITTIHFLMNKETGAEQKKVSTELKEKGVTNNE